MNRIRIIAVGKLKEEFYRAAQEEYLKRLRPYLKLEMVETSDLPCPERSTPAQEEQVLKQEGALIRSKLQPGDFVVVLDRKGKEIDSLEFAELVQERLASGKPLAFVIGGSLGVDPELLKEAQMRLSFSKLTFPHQLFRVVLLEQIYRAMKINRGERYHK